MRKTNSYEGRLDEAEAAYRGENGHIGSALQLIEKVAMTHGVEGRDLMLRLSRWQFFSR